MLFDQLKNGDEVYILEIVGTFKKTTDYHIGSVVSVSKPYDEPLPQGQFQMPNQPRKKVLDVTVQCGGESRKFTIPEGRSTITDAGLGLTIATDKSELSSVVRNQYNVYKSRKEAIAKCDEEMKRCEDILQILDVHKDKQEDPKIEALQREVDELRDIIKQASQMVPQPMKQMLPQNMQNVMNEVSQ